MKLLVVVFAGEETFEFDDVDFENVPRVGDDLDCDIEHNGDTVGVLASITGIMWSMISEKGDRFALPMVFANVDDPDELDKLGITPEPESSPESPRPIRRPRKWNRRRF